MAPQIASVRVGDWFDYQGVVAAPNGQRSWTMDTPRGERPVLLRTASQTTELRPGERLRVLGVRREEDSDMTHFIAEMTTHSEAYVLND